MTGYIGRREVGFVYRLGKHWRGRLVGETRCHIGNQASAGTAKAALLALYRSVRRG